MKKASQYLFPSNSDPTTAFYSFYDENSNSNNAWNEQNRKRLCTDSDVRLRNNRSIFSTPIHCNVWKKLRLSLAKIMPTYLFIGVRILTFSWRSLVGIVNSIKNCEEKEKKLENTEMAHPSTCIAFKYGLPVKLFFYSRLSPSPWWPLSSAATRLSSHRTCVLFLPSSYYLVRSIWLAVMEGGQGASMPIRLSIHCEGTLLL